MLTIGFSQSVESKVIKQQISCFCSIVKEQLQEKVRLCVAT